jgi:hypothetical protein
MNIFAKNEIIVFFLSLALLLRMAKLFGELFKRFTLPSVIGEIIAGIVFTVHCIVNHTLPWIQANTEWPGGLITFVIAIPHARLLELKKTVSGRRPFGTGNRLQRTRRQTCAHHLSDTHPIPRSERSDSDTR